MTDESFGAPQSPEQRPPSSRSSTLLALLVVFILGGGALFVSGFTLGRLAGATPGTTDANQDLFRPFWDAYSDVSSNYVGKIDPHLLVEGAIKGIFDTLNDPFSQYLTEEEYRASLGGISGEFEGVGLEMATQDAAGQGCAAISETCRLTVTHVVRRSPAAGAGFLEGDVVKAVDGASTAGKTLADVVPTIRGPKGTVVTLTVVRGTQTLDVPVTRDVIQREDVTSQLLANGRIGYLKVSGFSSASAQDLHDLLTQLIQTNHVEGLILDLRDDPGGYVDAAQKIASEFTGSDPLYWEQTATGAPQPQHPIPGGAATDTAVPMVVLVNGGTASASEIVSAALQGNGRALLIGSKTYGKGTIQEFKELPGAGGYRLSVRKWLTPDQTWIHGVGLFPNINIAPPDGEQPSNDVVLEKGIQTLLDELAGKPIQTDPPPTPSPAPTLSPTPSA
ncbi:MAG: S41 family peptidase [Chloroflexota bacterium]|nr:S41 family peptidase [Chloroflexota bacterium]